MGVASSFCLQREDFDREQRGTGCCCQHCCRCCWCCCCGMYAALFHPSEEHDTGSPSHNASPSQSAGLLGGGSSSGSSMPIIYGAPSNRRHLQPIGEASRPQKIAATLSRIRNLEPLQRRNGGDGGEGTRVTLHAKDTNNGEEKKSTDNVSKLQQSKTTGKVDPLTSSTDDEDICPTCLEGYDQENPKIDTKCGHHFHLACILEWMERSSQCPVCDQEMVFSETP